LEKFTADIFLNSGIKQLSQPEKGYRFSIDPFILAAHIKKINHKKILDVGCGCGIIPLILSDKSSCCKITGIEIQEELYLCAKKNIIANKLETTINIIHGDINNIHPPDINGKTDIIVSNPPYIKKGSGRLNPDSQKAIARHEITLDIDMLFKCSDRLLKKKGKLYLIFPASRRADLFSAMERYKFSLYFIRFVHITQNAPARFIILCAEKNNSRSCIACPPFYIYTQNNKSEKIFSDEYLSIFQGM
jgi:tRNA1Val (adenine37-N6)-methyltransferase